MAPPLPLSYQLLRGMRRRSDAVLETVARHLAAAASPAATKPARIGVIGTGWWATSRMMPDLVSIPGCELWAVVEPDSARRAEVAARFGIEHAFPDVSSLLGSAAASELDGCAVFSPHVEHFDNAMAVLNAGLPVLVEKPLTVTTAERNAADDARNCEWIVL